MLGGMETHGRFLWPGLAARGEKVTVISTAHPKSLTHETFEGVEFHFLDEVPTGSLGRNWRRHSVRKFQELQEQAAFDLACSQSAAAYPLAGQGTDIPLVSMLHGSPSTTLGSAWGEFVRTRAGTGELLLEAARTFRDYFLRDRPLIRGSSGIVCPSETARREIAQWYFVPKDRIEVIGYGVDAGAFAPDGEEREALRAELGLGGRDKVLLFLSTASRQKGLHLALQALPRLREKGHAVKLVVVGGGAELEQMKRLAGRLEVSGEAIFVGPVPQEKIPPYYRLCDLFVFPTLRRESFGIVLIESMLAGKPAVASRLGAIPGVIDDGLTGVLVRPGDLDDLVTRIDALLSRPERLLEMGARGREKALRLHDKEIMVERYLDFFRSVVGSGPAERTDSG